MKIKSKHGGEISVNYEFNRQWLIKKFEEIKNRTLKAIDQLNDEQLNWAPNLIAHNIPTLLRHIEGNINERIRKGICGEEVDRDRKKEFTRVRMTKEEAQFIVNRNFDYIMKLVKTISEEKFKETQIVRGKERLNVDILHQCVAHFSEHMGQIFYITKQCLQDNYRSTSL